MEVEVVVDAKDYVAGIDEIRSDLFLMAILLSTLPLQKWISKWNKIIINGK